MKPVLYAEDEPDDVFFMRHVWQLAGMANPLIDVKDGEQAINYLAGQGHFADRTEYPLPCLLLLDLNLPIKSGFEVLRWIRQRPRFNSLKVVIVSGSNNDDDLRNARKFRIEDYVVKPPNPNRLLEILLEKKHLWLP